MKRKKLDVDFIEGGQTMFELTKTFVQRSKFVLTTRRSRKGVHN